MSDSNKSQLATFRVDPELWESFKAQSRKNGKTASDVLTEFVQSYVASTDPSITQIDNLESHIDKKVENAIAPLKTELEVLREELEKYAA